MDNCVDQNSVAPDDLPLAEAIPDAAGAEQAEDDGLPRGVVEVTLGGQGLPEGVVVNVPIVGHLHKADIPRVSEDEHNEPMKYLKHYTEQNKPENAIAIAAPNGESIGYVDKKEYEELMKGFMDDNSEETTALMAPIYVPPSIAQITVDGPNELRLVNPVQNPGVVYEELGGILYPAEGTDTE